MTTDNQDLQVIQEPGSFDKTISIYNNASCLVLDEATEKKLLASFDETLIEIRPDGIIYLPQVFWRQRLNQSFGVGQWCLIVKSQTKDPNINKLYIEGVLMARGSYVATAVGEAEYHESNQNMSWASVWESAKSDCITRCCKDLGIAAELWQPQFVKGWISKNAVKVFVDVKGTKKTHWRNKNAEPFWNETGIVPVNSSQTKQPTTEHSQPQTEPQAEDNRPWLTEKQYKDALARIASGEDGILNKVNAAFRVKKDYRTGLQEAINFHKAA